MQLASAKRILTILLAVSAITVWNQPCVWAENAIVAEKEKEVQEVRIKNGNENKASIQDEEQELENSFINRRKAPSGSGTEGEIKPGETENYDNIVTGKVDNKDTDIAIGTGSEVNREYQYHENDGKWKADDSDGGTAVGNGASVLGGGGTAIGQNSKTVGEHSLAVGSSAQAYGENNVAIGANSGVGADRKGDGSIIGDKKPVTGGISIGTSSSVMANHGIAMGSSSKAYGPSSIAMGQFSSALGSNSIALGTNSKVEGEHENHPHEGIAIGSNALTEGFQGIALGPVAKSIGEYSVAIGQLSKAEGSHSIAVGRESKASGESALANGHLSNAEGYSSVAVGKGSKAIGAGSISAGSDSKASQDYAIAIGDSSLSMGVQSISMGYRSSATIQGSTAIGPFSKALGLNSIAFGYSSQALSAGAIAMGRKSKVSGANSIALGDNTIVLSQNSVALGTGANVKEGSGWSVAIGDRSAVSAQQAIAMGYKSAASGEKAIAVGSWSNASGLEAVAFGYNSKASSYSTAVGSWSNASGEKAAAFGYNAQAKHANSVALGGYSITEEAIGTKEFTLKSVKKVDGSWQEVDITFGDFAGANPFGTVSVGKVGFERTITNVAAGRISATSTDAINGSQLYAVADGLQKQIDEIKKDDSNDHYHTVNGNDKETGTEGSAITSDEKQDIVGDMPNNPPADSSNLGTDNSADKGAASGGTNTDPVGDKPTLGGGYVGGDGNLLIKHDTDKNGDKYYDISLNKDLDLNSINVKNEIKVGDKVTIKGDEINVGDNVTIKDDSIKVGDITINEGNIDMGDNKIINVGPGTDGTDAVNVNQLNELEQNITNNINNINGKVDKLDGKINKVGAGAAALAALHPLDFDPDDKLSFSAGVGHYEVSTAAALGAFYQPNDDTLLSVGGTVGNGEEMVNLGVSVRFGQHSNQSRSKKAMAKEIIELRTEVAELKAMVYSLTGRGFDPYKSEIFPDIPENHWAYDYVAVVTGNGILEGYPNGKFDGNREMTRYEMAAVIYRLMTKGVQVDDRMLKEFAPELARVRVDTLTYNGDGTPSIQRVRVIEGRG